jgi:hypothetical protein
MKIELSYKCVGGTDRGGEDVSLHVEITSARYPSREDVEQAFEECLLSLPVRLSPDDTGEKDGVYVSGGHVCTVESEYEFCVQEEVQAVRDLVLKVHLAALDPASREGTPEWVQSLRSGVYKLEFDAYTHGNAE